MAQIYTVMTGGEIRDVIMHNTGFSNQARRREDGNIEVGWGHIDNSMTLGKWVSTYECHFLFESDYEAAAAAICHLEIPCVDSVRQCVLVDIAFCIGGRGLRSYPQMLGHMCARDWGAAAREFLMTCTLRDAGPNRAHRNAAALLTGIYVI